MLWGSERRDAAVRIVNLYGHSGAPGVNRVALHLMTSDLAADIGDTALARRQPSKRSASASRRPWKRRRARLLALRIRELELLTDVDAAYMRDSTRIHGTTLQKRIADDLLLIHMFLSGPNEGGAGVFNAAELARDSLRSYPLAHALFLSVERDFPDFQTAARRSWPCGRCSRSRRRCMNLA